MASIETAALAEAEAATEADALKEVRHRYLGRKRGALKDALSCISKVPATIRGEFGSRVNAAKKSIEAGIKRRVWW